MYCFLTSRYTYTLLALQIMTSEVCNSAQTLCNSIAAIFRPSKAVVEVKNNATDTSSYTVSVGSCTHPLVAIPSQTISLAADTSEDVLFEVINPPLSPTVNSSCRPTQKTAFEYTQAVSFCYMLLHEAPSGLSGHS